MENPPPSPPMFKLKMKKRSITHSWYQFVCWCSFLWCAWTSFVSNFGLKTRLNHEATLDPYRWLLKLAGERPADWMTGAATSPATLGAATAILTADATKTFDWTLVLGVVVAWTEEPPICNGPAIPACRGPLLSRLWLPFRTFELRPPERKEAASAPIWPDLSPSPALLSGLQFAVLRFEAVFCGTSWKRLFRAVEPDQPGENGPRSLLLLKVLNLLPFPPGNHLPAPASKAPSELKRGLYWRFWLRVENGMELSCRCGFCWRKLAVFIGPIQVGFELSGSWFGSRSRNPPPPPPLLLHWIRLLFGVWSKGDQSF